MSDVKIFARTIEDKAQQQIEQLANLEAFKDSKIRIMPDVHAGAGCVIGFTADLGNKVIPNVVGVDIGCGMLAGNIGRREIDLAALDNIINKEVPSGMNVREKCLPFSFTLIEMLRCRDQLKNIEWLYHSMGTLGGGNHFIEVDIDEKTGEKWLIIHSGSRNLGKQVADIYQNIAIQKCNNRKYDAKRLIEEYKTHGKEKEIAAAIKTLKDQNARIPNNLCYLEGEDRENYLHDMKLCQDFAKANRANIAAIIMCEAFRILDFVDSFETIHNYIDDNNMVRKGAISAQKGEKLLIPINMRDGCILGVGKGNEDWNYSAPHGAGRLMSRKKAKELLAISDYQNSMSGIYTTSVCSETIDEAPQAYKPLEEITALIKPTVDIISILKPIYNFKAKE